jgi:hypothetical protein
MKRGKGCDGKVRHRTKADATAHAASLRQRGAVRVEAYWCSAHCAWHVGNRRPPARKRRRY